MIRATLPLIGCLLWGCTLGSDRPGTYVGNPGKKVIRLGPERGLDIVEAVGEQVSVHWLLCDGGFVGLTSDTEYDLLEPADIEVPFGSWCAVVLTLERPVLVSGLGEHGEGGEAVFNLSLRPTPSVITLWAAAPILVDDNAFVLELGDLGWLDSELLPLEEGENNFAADGEVAQFITQRLTGQIHLYADLDESGDLDETERATGAVAAASFEPPDALVEPEEPVRVSGETGCSAAPGSLSGGGWGLGLAMLLAWRRRRSTAP